MALRDGAEGIPRGRLSAVATRTDASPLAAVDAFAPPTFAWRDPGGTVAVGSGAVAEIATTGELRVPRLKEAAAGTLRRLQYDGPSAARPRVFTGMAFDPDAPAGDPWTGFPPAYGLIPRVMVSRADGPTFCTVTSTESMPSTLETAVQRIESTQLDYEGPPGVKRTTHVPDRATWEAGVSDAVERIRGGELQKVVLAGNLKATLDRTPSLGALLDRLATTYPDCYVFGVDLGDGVRFVGASPELLADREDDRVRTMALAGSAGRDEREATDVALATEMTAGEKHRREHRLVLDAVENRLDPYVSSVDVGDRQVRKLRRVQHLETPIEGRLRDGIHVLDVVEALHPTPAVGGLPKGAATRLIQETEPFSRGWYAGPVGWFDAAGNGTFGVGIRSAVLEGRAATLYAGSGIVADSDPADEFEELRLKYRPILDHLE